MTEAAIALRGPSVAMNPWLVAAAVVVPTFMEVLDTTIAVVALRYIAGGLSATVNDGEWVITSYLAANAIILPITAWLINRFGRRNYFLASIAVFTVASGLAIHEVMEAGGDVGLSQRGFAPGADGDASILPRITTGNTMAPCVIVGERAADLLKATHGLSVAALAA